jgi:hypothetical protein
MGDVTTKSHTKANYNSNSLNRKSTLTKRKITSSSTNASLKCRNSSSNQLTTQNNTNQNQNHVATTKSSAVNLKKFGISPRFKRKIVEAISKTSHNQNNKSTKLMVISYYDYYF